MSDQCSLPWWVKDNGPTSIRHRLRCAAIAASPKGSVTFSAGLTSDIVDALDGAAKVVNSAEALGRASLANVKLQRLSATEQRAWRLTFFVVGFLAGSGVADTLRSAWSVFHAG